MGNQVEVLERGGDHTDPRHDPLPCADRHNLVRLTPPRWAIFTPLPQLTLSVGNPVRPARFLGLVDIPNLHYDEQGRRREMWASASACGVPHTSKTNSALPTNRDVCPALPAPVVGLVTGGRTQVRLGVESVTYHVWEQLSRRQETRSKNP